MGIIERELLPHKWFTNQNWTQIKKSLKLNFLIIGIYDIDISDVLTLVLLKEINYTLYVLNVISHNDDNLVFLRLENLSVDTRSKHYHFLHIFY